MIGMLGEKLGAKIGLELDETGRAARACASRTAPARRESATGLPRVRAEPIRDPREEFQAPNSSGGGGGAPLGAGRLALTAQMWRPSVARIPGVDAPSDSRSPITTHHRLRATRGERGGSVLGATWRRCGVVVGERERDADSVALAAVSIARSSPSTMRLEPIAAPATSASTAAALAQAGASDQREGRRDSPSARATRRARCRESEPGSDGRIGPSSSRCARAAVARRAARRPRRAAGAAFRPCPRDGPRPGAGSCWFSFRPIIVSHREKPGLRLSCARACCRGTCA